MKKLIVICMMAMALTACATSNKRGVKQVSKFRGCSTVGAIRWDAWYGDIDAAGRSVTRSLGPDHWHYRLPFCAKVIVPNEVQINCATQDVMDKEIVYAKHAGIDYWVFGFNSSSSPLSLGLKNYLSSTKKSDINFSLRTVPSVFLSRKDYNDSINRLISMMGDSSYQKVTGDRPLLFIAFITDSWIINEWGTDAPLRAIIDEFRLRTQKAGLGNPYITVMDFSPKRAQELANRFGFDAISAYAMPGDGGMKSHQYARLKDNAEYLWNNQKATGMQVIPTVMAGWDRRPRVENPVPWEHGKGDITKYYEAPTPIELGQHLKNALEWVKTNSSYSQANSVIIYAWNEFDEGGWIAPTLLEGTARLDAIGEVIRGECSAKR